ncbi:MAG: hypothetical protein PHG89_10415, partial [Gallionella sp.]|nr:hypothetical protein [Gallionella sp.]
MPAAKLHASRDNDTPRYAEKKMIYLMPQQGENENCTAITDREDKMPNDHQHKPLNLNLSSVKQSMNNHLIFSVGKDTITATHRDWFFALAEVVRERLIERWMETMRRY